MSAIQVSHLQNKFQAWYDLLIFQKFILKLEIFLNAYASTLCVVSTASQNVGADPELLIFHQTKGISQSGSDKQKNQLTLDLM